MTSTTTEAEVSRAQLLLTLHPTRLPRMWVLLTDTRLARWEKALDKTKRRTGYEGFLLINYNIKADKLAALMNELRREFLESGSARRP